MTRILFFLLFITTSLCTVAQVQITSIKAVNASAPLTTDIITIPVVIHVVYNTPQQNISDAQIRSQIDVLNKDYRGTNEDRKNIPSYFAALAADGGFEFRLAAIDPIGRATSGIVRKQTNIKMFGVDDRIKSSTNGGDDAWDRNKYLNIWVCNLAGGILGYTSTIGGPAEKDGVTIQFTAFGTTGTVAAPFNLGRTATHEIGHWLNLKHIWGDTFCGDDEVDDTPKQRSSNKGRPTGEKLTCDMTGHGDMYMNFMDLTDDAGMFMFTKGQRVRMRMLFANGQQRHEILSSNAITGTPITVGSGIDVAAVAVATRVLSAYPNPAVSTITINLNNDGLQNANKIVIYNYIGQPVIMQTMTGSRISVNVSQLKPGIYFVKTADDSATMTKFVKS